MGGARQTALFALTAFAVTVATFAPSAGHEFVRIDDHEYVTENRHIARGLTWDAAKWALSDVGYASNWHPLTWMCHALDVSVARALGVIGEAPQDRGAAWVANGSGLAKVSHVHNVLLHGLNAALLFLVMAGMARGGAINCRRSSILLFAALLWAVHPLRCEAVCWVSERKELLSVFWMLAALAMWVRASNEAKPSVICRLSSILFAALALMAKPVAVSLPAVVFAYEWMMRGQSFRRAALRALPFGALSAVVCVLTLCAQKEGLASGEQYGWLMRLECAIEAPLVYLRQTLAPTGLSPEAVEMADAYVKIPMYGFTESFNISVCGVWRGVGVCGARADAGHRQGRRDGAFRQVHLLARMRARVRRGGRAGDPVRPVPV